jgi:general secretion pathway protein G
MRTNQKGFTLIEILIVVAIIAILASVVLVGLGPTQQKGRDARRLSDLREIQNGLELYYNANGSYPDGNSTQEPVSTMYSNNASQFTSAGISQAFPGDPTGSGNFQYEYYSNGTSYAIGDCLEGTNPPAYQPPTSGVGQTLFTSLSAKCQGGASSTYVLTL